MESPDADVRKRREEFFSMCEEAVQVMNATADHLLRFNFKCIALGRPADPGEVEALADLMLKTRQACDLIRQRNAELFAASGLIPPFDLVFDRLGQISAFVEVLMAQNGL